MSDDEQSIDEKYSNIMKYASLVVPSNKDQVDLSQPSPLEVVESFATNNSSNLSLQAKKEGS